MGKKRTKVKFIDKKKAISFHLVAKADHGDEAEEEEREEQEMLNRELLEQKNEERAKLGLPPLQEGEAEAEGEEGAPNDDRINLLNLAAAAEGIETRAVRQARKAAKESAKQKFYLQPTYNPRAPNAQIPKDFPQEALYTGQVDAAEEEYWAKEDAKKYELEVQADAPALLPHNYDYEKHLKPISGRGMFMEAKRGDELYDHENDPRDWLVKPAAKQTVSGTVVSASGSSSLSLHAQESKEDDAESDDDMPPLDPDDNTPVNPELLASIERFQKKLTREGRRARLQKDFVKALEGEDQEEEFEELNDDFVIQAMEGAIGAAAEEEEEEEEYEPYGEYVEEEYYEDEEEDDEGKEEEGEEKARRPRSSTAASSSSRRPRYTAADDDDDYFDEEKDGDDDEDLPAGTELDAAFDKVLEEYDDDEIGELDHYQDEDPEAIEGALDLDDIQEEVDEFLTAKDKFKSEGGAIIDTVDEQLQQLTLKKLEIVTKGEKTTEEIESDLDHMLDPPVREQWDAESILSTYSNTENHPRVLREHGRSRRKQSRGDISAAQRQQLAAFHPPLPVPEKILRLNDGEDGIDEEDEEEEDEDAGVERENRGKAREVGETPEEKKARKQAAKEAKRLAKERKKQLKTLYVQETAAAMAKQARLNKANPPNIRKL